MSKINLFNSIKLMYIKQNSSQHKFSVCETVSFCASTGRETRTVSTRGLDHFGHWKFGTHSFPLFIHLPKNDLFIDNTSIYRSDFDLIRRLFRFFTLVC